MSNTIRVVMVVGVVVMIMINMTLIWLVKLEV
jgi:hypothetical protein